MVEHHMSEEALANLCQYLNSAHYYITRDEIRAAMRGDFAKPLPAPPIPPMSKFLNAIEEDRPLSEKLLMLKELFQGASYSAAVHGLIDECIKPLEIFEEKYR